MSLVDVSEAGRRAVCDVMAVRPGEAVVVAADDFMPPRVITSLVQASRDAGAEVRLVMLAPRERPVPAPGEPEQPAAEIAGEPADAIAEADVVFALAHPILNNVAAERAALARGARVLRMLLCDFYAPVDDIRARAADIEAAFVRAHSVDIAATARLTRDACVAIAAARETRITTPGGTDLRILATPRGATDGAPPPGPGANPVQCVDGECHEPGTWDESCGGVTAVLPDDAEGVVVVDHSIPPLGLLREPIRLRVEARRVTRIEGGAEAGRLREWLDATGAASAFTCPAEWGVGTHAACIDSGNFLEHEKALGAVHVALGDDRRFGGASAAPVHIDGVMRDARVELDGRVILDHGRFLL